MNLQQLRYAQMIAEHGSFVEAANRCGVTQPTLSNGIAQLERELGTRLFVRTTRTVRLTEQGQELMACIVDVLNAQAALVGKARALTQPAAQLIRIGVSPLIGMDLVNLIVDPFRRTNPNVDIVFRELNLADMMRALDVGHLDFVFCPADPDSEPRGDRNSVDFHREPLVFLSKGAALQPTSAFKSVALKDIAEETFVLVPDSCGLTRLTRAIFRRNRIKLREYAGTAMSYRVLGEWAELGIGAAILPSSKVQTGKGPEITLRKSGGSPLMITYQVIGRRSDAKRSAITDLGTYLRDVAPSIMPGVADSEFRG
jgi:LysR family transcriptional regulator, hydrogen peroxide-inducible genes activator